MVVVEETELEPQAAVQQWEGIMIRMFSTFQNSV